MYIVTNNSNQQLQAVRSVTVSLFLLLYLNQVLIKLWQLLVIGITERKPSYTHPCYCSGIEALIGSFFLVFTERYALEAN